MNGGIPVGIGQQYLIAHRIVARRSIDGSWDGAHCLSGKPALRSQNARPPLDENLIAPARTRDAESESPIPKNSCAKSRSAPHSLLRSSKPSTRWLRATMAVARS
jgi:hypothetical protein